MASARNRALPPRFLISEEILNGPSLAGTSHAKILQLHPESLLMIFNMIDHPKTQIFFALCCKAFARVARLGNLAQTFWYMFKKRYYYQLPHLMRDLRPYMPATLQLCQECCKYLPKQRVWKDKRGRNITQLCKVDWMWAVKSWLGGGRMCPTCQIPENYDDSEGWLQCWPEGFVQMVMISHRSSEA